MNEKVMNCKNTKFEGFLYYICMVVSPAASTTYGTNLFSSINKNRKQDLKKRERKYRLLITMHFSHQLKCSHCTINIFDCFQLYHGNHKLDKNFEPITSFPFSGFNLISERSCSHFFSFFIDTELVSWL